MIGPLLALSLGLWLCLSCLDCACAADASVQVRLFEAFAPPAAIAVSGPLEVLYPLSWRMPPGSYELAARGGKVELVASKNQQRRPVITGQRLVLRGPAKGLALTYPGKPARRYRGTITVWPAGPAALRIINELSARQYVAAVIGSESPPTWPAEALKCQAVLTQTRLCRYRTGDPLGDSTQQEAYLGAAYERPEAKAAVEAVWGWILTYHGRPITPYYHAACAGQTSDGGEYFHKPGLFPYLSSVMCSHCRRSPFQKKKRSVIPYQVYRQAFPQGAPVVSKTDAAGRPLELKFNDGTRTTGYDYWVTVGQKLGWDKVPGTRFSLSLANDGAIVFESTGAGHGVGLCQWGASELARRNWSFRSILQYYFPGTTVKRR